MAEIRDSWQKYYVALNLDPVGFWIGLNDKIGEGKKLIIRLVRARF